MEQSLSTLIQGGAVGIALVCLWVIYKLVTNHDKHLQGLVDRNTDAWIKNTQALTKLTDGLKIRRWKPKS